MNYTESDIRLLMEFEGLYLALASGILSALAWWILFVQKAKNK